MRDDFEQDDVLDEIHDEERRKAALAEEKAKAKQENAIPEYLKGVATGRGKYYLTNADLLPAVLDAKSQGKVTDKLARMLMLLTMRYSLSSSFAGYSYREDMVSAALVNLCQNALKFDPAKSSNPFAFYTKAIHRSFLQYMSDEKKQHYIRDVKLIEEGHDPSHNFKDNIILRKMKAREAESKRKAAEKAAAKAGTSTSAAPDESADDSILGFDDSAK